MRKVNTDSNYETLLKRSTDAWNNIQIKGERLK